MIRLPDLTRHFVHAEQPALQCHHDDADLHLAEQIALGAQARALGDARADRLLEPRFAQDSQCFLCRIAREDAARARGAEPRGRRIGGNRLEPRVRDAVVRVENAGRDLTELADVAKEQDALDAALCCLLEHEADEVARLYKKLLRQAPRLRQVLADLARHEDELLGTIGARDVDLRHERVLEPLLRHGPQHAGRADDGDAALDAEDGVQRLLGQLFPRRDGDCDVQAVARADGFARRAAHELARAGIDGGLADGDREPRLCHRADALASREGHRAARHVAHRREDGDAVRDVGVVARELDDLCADARLRPRDRLDGNRELRAVEGRERDGLPVFPRFKEQGRLDPRRRTGPSRITASHARHLSAADG